MSALNAGVGGVTPGGGDANTAAAADKAPARARPVTTAATVMAVGGVVDPGAVITPYSARAVVTPRDGGGSAVLTTASARAGDPDEAPPGAAGVGGVRGKHAEMTAVNERLVGGTPAAPISAVSTSIAAA